MAATSGLDGGGRLEDGVVFLGSCNDSYSCSSMLLSFSILHPIDTKHAHTTTLLDIYL